ncbi:MAG: site-specific DNA-methyltransferase [Syntrophales bacterium]|jgi:adenine-specific DNA-methyltransferase
MEIEKLDLKSVDIVEEKREQLKALFPEAFTEGQKIDFERLKLALGEMVDPGKERYGMNWPGKADCFKIIQQPSIAALTPARDESVAFDTTENLFIEGDNLEVLKLLQKSYFGKVKMIYIDPPYNTGNDFIYPDDYSESLDTYLRYTGQIDNEGRKYSTNTEADGRFHSKWMNMMYPRLFLARNLLREDGVIFISIDDHEVSNLRKLCDEIFGEVNFIEQIIWKKRYGGGAKEKHLVSVHEYILVYAKQIESIGELFVPYSQVAIERYYTQKDERIEERGPYRTHPLEATKSMGERRNLVFPITAPDGTEVMPKRQWLWSKDRVTQALSKGDLAFLRDKDGNWSVHTKQYLKDENGDIRKSKAFSIIDNVFTQHGTNEIIDLFGDAQIFPFPKPTGLLKPLLDLVADKDSIILDFFAGTASSTHAVLELNKDGGNRKFIMVQLPEPTDENSEAHKAGYKTIADIGKERIRRVIKRIKDEQEKKKDMFSGDKPQPDLGFKVFKLQPSNFKLWDGDVAKDEEAIKKQIELFVEHINPQSSQEDILYEILLKSGFPLTTKIEKTVLAERDVFSIADGSMLICLEKDLTPEVIKEMAEMKPVRVVCLDEGFKGNDQLKTNAVQIMKTRNITFRTV